MAKSDARSRGGEWDPNGGPLGERENPRTPESFLAGPELDPADSPPRETVEDGGTMDPFG